jgi:hypothetical protein
MCGLYAVWKKEVDANKETSWRIMCFFSYGGNTDKQNKARDKHMY